MGDARARYTLEFNLEAVRMVRAGRSIAAVAKILNICSRMLHNWIKADATCKLKGADVKVSPEQMGIAQQRAKLAHVKIKRAILEKATLYFAKVPA